MSIGLFKKKFVIIGISVTLAATIVVVSIVVFLNLNSEPRVKTIKEIEKVTKYEGSESGDDNVDTEYDGTDAGYDGTGNQHNFSGSGGNSKNQENGTGSNPSANTVRTRFTKALPKGENNEYYTVKPSVEHPGVVDMDAKYEMIVTDIDGDIVTEGFQLKVNNKKVKMEGNVLTIPYEVRSGYDRVKVTAINKTNSGLTGTYTFKFDQFTKTPVFEDDFDFLDLTKWGMHRNRDIEKLSIKDGVLYQRADMGTEDDASSGISTFQKSTYDYGSYSVSMAAPKKGYLDCGIWLMCYGTYLPNPMDLSDSQGEFDICELFPDLGVWGASLHAFGYGENHQETHSQFSLSTYDYTAFNTYSLVWTPVGAYWYLNGELVKAYSGEIVGPGSGKMCIILSCHPLADPSKETNSMWGVTIGKVDPNDYPAVTKFDWIKVYGLEY